ncbi:MAG: hypothetical protein ACBR13_20460 [Microcoleus sp.]
MEASSTPQIKGILTNNNTGKFTGNAKKTTIELVLGNYLIAKIANLIGVSVKDIQDETEIEIVSNYGNDEGEIFNMSQQNGFVQGLRIDLQSCQMHNQLKYATFQVQWGTGMDGKKGGAYAGALMRVDTKFPVSLLREALQNSFQTQTYWRIDPPVKSSKGSKQ